VTAKILDALSYPFSEKDRVLLDANVWLSVYGPNAPGSERTRKYSQVLKAMQVAKTAVFLDVLVLSEFVNAYARTQHKILALSGAPISSDFKTFRESGDFAQIAKEIHENALKIGRLAQPLDHPLTKCDLVSVLTVFAQGRSDINDQLLAECCKVNNLLFLTHDADLGASGVTVLTTNHKLLPRRR